MINRIVALFTRKNKRQMKRESKPAAEVRVILIGRVW